MWKAHPRPGPRDREALLYYKHWPSVLPLPQPTHSLPTSQPCFILSYAVRPSWNLGSGKGPNAHIPGLQKVPCLCGAVLMFVVLGGR